MFQYKKIQPRQRVLKSNPDRPRVGQTLEKSWGKEQSKKTPPKNLEQIIQQSNNRRALAPQKLFKATNPKTKTLTRWNDPRKTTVELENRAQTKRQKLQIRISSSNVTLLYPYLQSQNLRGKRNRPKSQPLKNLTQKKLQRSLTKNAAARPGREQAGKLGNAIPINKIDEQAVRSKNVICQVQIVPATSQTNTENTPVGGTNTEVVSLSSSVECTKIQLDTLSPEQVRADMEEVCDSSVKEIQQQPNEVPQPLTEPDRAISSTYVIDRPPKRPSRRSVYEKFRHGNEYPAIDIACQELNDLSTRTRSNCVTNQKIVVKTR